MVVIGLAMVAADRHWRCVCYLRLLEIKQFSLLVFAVARLFKVIIVAIH